MMTETLFLVTIVLAALLALASVRLLRARRESFIRTYMFPPGLFDRLADGDPRYPLKDRQLVARALRQFFLAYLTGGRRQVSMPSQVTDDLWHEFILYTRHYDRFCSRAFGRFLHHTPAVALGADRQNNEGLRRVWWRACLEENINPRKPTRLPLLFAIDEKLGITDGFRYAPDCQALQRRSDGTNVQCGGDLGNGCAGGSGGSAIVGRRRIRQVGDFGAAVATRVAAGAAGDAAAAAAAINRTRVASCLSAIFVIQKLPPANACPLGCASAFCTSIGCA